MEWKEYYLEDGMDRWEGRLHGRWIKGKEGYMKDAMKGRLYGSKGGKIIIDYSPNQKDPKLIYN